MKLITFMGAFVIFSNTLFAGRIETDLQAVILSPQYATAATDANRAVTNEGVSFVATLGETSRMDGEGPGYFYYIPVKAIRVPLSPLKPKLVGHIVANLEFAPNAPVPLVNGVYFKAVGDVPDLE